MYCAKDKTFFALEFVILSFADKSGHPIGPGHPAARSSDAVHRRWRFHFTTEFKNIRNQFFRFTKTSGYIDNLMISIERVGKSSITILIQINQGKKIRWLYMFYSKLLRYMIENVRTAISTLHFFPISINLWKFTEISAKID